jgi:hypothetical protein
VAAAARRGTLCEPYGTGAPQCVCVRGWRGGRGAKDNVPFGQVFHKSSFTRPTVVSGSNAIDRRRPETSKNCTSVCGTCGTTAPVSSSSRSTSGGGGALRASAPSPPPGPGTGSSARWWLWWLLGISPAAVPGRVSSTRVNEVRVLAGRAAISSGMDLVNVGREDFECEGLG